MNHPFTKVEHLSEWYLVGQTVFHEHIIICRDLDDAGWAYRILCVVEGNPEPDESVKMRAEKLLWWVVAAHEANGHEFSHIDRVCRKIKDHWHVQACFSS